MAKDTCSIKECERPARARGWCVMHHQRWRKHGDPLVKLIGTGVPKFCTVEGCDRTLKGLGLCELHLTRQKKCGDPRHLALPTVMERLWRKLDKVSDAPCWRWTGGTTSAGYGLTSVNGERMLAHRAFYTLLVAPIDPGLEVDHLCFNKWCVNPAHLEPVTSQENTRRALAAGRKQVKARAS